ncbi:MAG: hypothetical protein HY778_01060 [Betaproteobacteria bacterium]|nr:hypothetical protein [Betaproteobacteria bacterium]
MKLIRRGVPLLLIGLALLAGGCATHTTTRAHPDFAAGKRQVRTVALLPADAEQVKLVFTGENERDRDFEQSAGTELRATAHALLVGAGYEVRNTVSDKIEGGDKNAAFEYEQFKEAYNRASRELYKTASVSQAESRGFNVSLGASVNTLAALADADALLFARYRGFSKSGGMVAKDIVAGTLLALATGVMVVAPKAGGAVEVALVDGVTGNVLWSNVARAPGPDATTALRLAMKPLPAKAPDGTAEVAKTAAGDVPAPLPPSAPATTSMAAGTTPRPPASGASAADPPRSQ